MRWQAGREGLLIADVMLHRVMLFFHSTENASRWEPNPYFFSLSPLCFAATHFFLVPSLEAADHLQVAATIAKASFTTQKIHIILAARTSLPKLMLIAAAQAKFLSPAYWNMTTKARTTRGKNNASFSRNAPSPCLCIPLLRGL
jgi:hypothetical protein